MKEKILLVGGGGHCHSVIDVIETEGKYQIVGIIDRKELIGKKILSYTIIASDNELEKLFKTCKNIFITVGQIKSFQIRKNLFDKVKDIGFNLPVIISPLAYVSKHSIIKEGTIIMHHAIINANSSIGSNCIINTKALIEHDCTIANNCHISTASILNGEVTVEENSFIGSNSVVIQGTLIKENSFIKAGEVIK